MKNTNILRSLREDLKKAEKKIQQEKCEHINLEFLHTYEDFIDGDEDDIYRCEDCGARVTIYIGR